MLCDREAKEEGKDQTWDECGGSRPGIHDNRVAGR